MSLRDVLADTGADFSKFMFDFAVGYIQDAGNFDNVDEANGLGPPASINHIVEIDPLQADYGQAKSGNGWRYLGDSTGGLALSIGRDTFFLDTDQHARAIEKHQQWNIALTGGLAQYEVEAGTLDNLLLVLGGGTLSDIGGTPSQKLVTIPLGSGITYQRAALIYPHEYNNNERTICVVLRKCAVKSTGELSFTGRGQANIPVRLDAVIDDRPTVPSTKRLIYAFFAPGA